MLGDRPIMTVEEMELSVAGIKVLLTDPAMFRPWDSVASEAQLRAFVSMQQVSL